MESQGLSVQEAAKYLGIGRTLAYQEIRAGRIPSIKIGGRLIVPRAALDKILQAADRPERHNDEAA